MGKEKDRFSELEQFSRGTLRALFSKWVVNSLDQEDYAFDFEIRPRGFVHDHGEVTPAPFFVQLKASERFDDEDSVYCDLDTEYVRDDCLQATIPVVLLLYERRSDSFHWTILQRYCWDVLDDAHEDWREQDTVRVRVPRNPLRVREENHQLRAAVEDVQRRITLRSHVAAQRIEFKQPPGSTLAPASEVEAHKDRLLEEARIMLEADHETRALEKIMRVYQMPEEDEPTLDAIRSLLELRDLDSPATAFTQQRLARQGLRLAEAFDREELVDDFEDVFEPAWSYIEDEFIGAQYRDTEQYREFTVLDVSSIDRGEAEPLWRAHVQERSGELADHDARAIASGDRYTCIESGAGRHPWRRPVTSEPTNSTRRTSERHRSLPPVRSASSP